MKKKTVELISLPIYFLLIGAIVSFLKLTYLPTVLLYFGLPSVYITLSKQKIFRKTLLYSFLVSIPVVFIVDYLATASNAWYEQSTLNMFILNTIPLDAFVWGFLFNYFVISFYEYFLDKGKIKKRFSKKIKYEFYLSILVIGIFGVIYKMNKEWLVVKYFYIIFIILACILPSFMILRKYPNLLKKSLFVSIYFTLIFLIYEISALYTKQWGFEGAYLFRISLFNLSFPIEELLWMLLAVPAFILVYEYFADDKK